MRCPRWPRSAATKPWCSRPTGCPGCSRCSPQPPARLLPRARSSSGRAWPGSKPSPRREGWALSPLPTISGQRRKSRCKASEGALSSSRLRRRTPRTLAAEQGGNCELTRAKQIVVEDGVTLIGTINLASTVPYHASQMYARNISAFLIHLFKNGQLGLDSDDKITRETLVTRGGEVVNRRVREFFSLPAKAAQSDTGRAP